MVLRLLLIAAGLLLLGVSTPAAAQQCSASATTLAFGTFATPTNTPQQSTATVSISCAGEGTAIDLRLCPFLGGGSYGGGANGPRQLGNGTARLDFDVFSDASNTQRFPNDMTDPTTPAVVLSVPASGSATATVVAYGRIPANQTSAATGDYSASLASGVFFGPATTFTDCAGSAAKALASFTMAVTATNSPFCTVSTSPVAFGTVAGLGAVVDAVGAIGVTCSAGTSYTVALDGGANGGTSATTRKMAFSRSRVTYGLFRDAARTQGWYNSAGTTGTGTGSGALQSVPVYGRVPVQTTPPNGNYTDTVTVTLTY